MSAPAKFLFEDDFGRGESRARPSGVPQALVDAAVAEARGAGFREGVLQGRLEGARDAQEQIAAVLERIAGALAAAARDLEGLEARVEAEATALALAIAGKLAPALIAREPFAEVAALAAECFRSLLGTPHIVVRVNDALYETAKAKLGEIAAASSFGGRLVVLAEPDIAPGDCRIEWADGGVLRNRADTETAVADLVSRYLAARAGMAG